ncbi:hypothetical protein COS93_01305 [bacterium (Candidatus Gribaldobacteria) CG07_land_8_20_14_0_80_33_18]|uniref:UDP-N-acetylmuramoyl-L-alanyl-D-glutamate--2, 6-diaminopimelate ligase n=1 Tax=bacterium (Candidatus Gribaldobacteria) CG07_land_8_20_14_0_80_33_18 TaxID=2014272 RepID=A0A2M6Z3E6_9BACT|nr:MAG: hypothetical protein COU04_00930 [bacterium (Candidatus Gribaldobacteria) CG10_big_fil_rev_8_21_14_0_10_33_41]PIU46929.1 MAG: hypothetical protein COS93_01305 [bacterium (Candidatus Gribaldobacteria) CG07_land_8_20_14_0_80_33_18]PJA01003.1 MAG: hypothetical protein COX75_00975 [bacterium (Candidatus Gribaldobacteria) CG_4_10_14_0_2_um_filter_33_15]PJB08772.1 MAG: hypothetical protein CO122_00875 [bacterium (Candidatus Gribaldobacteria) CG_4_9_14_3_um_filter_33_9]
MKETIKKFIPAFLIGWYHFFLAFLGVLIYRFPSCLRRQAKKIKVIGITGTKGKSTVVELASRILENAGYKVASLSSIKFKIGEKEWPNKLKMTMPGRMKVQRFLREAVNSNCQYAILEVTSEGILQHRHQFIDFNVVVFTNLSPEHIERHGSFENYRKAKGKLFKACKKVHILNLDDENVNYFLQFKAEKKFGFTSTSIKELPTGLNFEIEDIKFELNLLGQFNVYNALAAICIGLSQGIDLETCKSSLERIKGIPGRMEEVISQPFKVIVDYAHTPDSLESVYKTLSDSKLICVLGAAGGGRDKWKRPKMGEIASKYCQKIILTNEDPYDESPLKILEDIEKGFPQTLEYEKILDRREAIKKALSLAKKDDTIIITGKGCEPWMCVAGGKKIPWDDRQVVKEEFEKL